MLLLSYSVEHIEHGLYRRVIAVLARKPHLIREILQGIS